MTPLPVVVADGAPHERGRRIGRALPDAVGRSLAGFALERERLGVDRAELERRVAPLVFVAERLLPAHVERLRGLAEGADASFVDVFAVNAWEEVLPDEAPESGRSAERCTSVAVRTPDGAVLLGHNEQWSASELGNVAIVVERPADGPAVVSPTPASMLPSVGVNAFRLAVGVDSLVAHDDRSGLPRLFSSRHVLDAADLADVLARARLPGRAGGYAYVVAARASGRVGAVEQSAERAEALPVEARGDLSLVCHTNHYLHPDLVGLEASPSLGSRSRLEEIRSRIAAAPPATAEDLALLLAGHDGMPQPICVHPVPGDPASAATLFSMVYDGAGDRLLVTAGNPCEGAFDVFELRDLLG